MVLLTKRFFSDEWQRMTTIMGKRTTATTGRFADDNDLMDNVLKEP